MTLETFLVIAQTQVVLSVLVVLMSFYRYRQRAIETRLVGLTFLLGPIIFAMIFITELKGKSVNIPQSINAILYFLGLTALYNFALKRRYKKFFLATAVLFSTFAIANLLFIQQDDNNTYSQAARSVILVGFCVLFFYRLMEDLPEQHLQRVPMFWYNAGILIYNAGTLFLFLFAAYFIDVLHNNLLLYWSFHNILNIIQHLIVMIGLWQDLRNIKSRSS